VSYSTLGVERNADGTALVTIQRPEKLNAMNRAFFSELPQLMQELDDDPHTKVAVITGQGRAFSAGGDIEDFDALDGSIDAARRQVRAALDAFNAVERAETVAIAAVNGIAYGGGTELTLCCDIALASTQAKFAFKEITLGLMPGYGLVRAPEVIGRAHTHWLTLSADTIDADKAHRIGLVQHISEDDVVKDALQLAARIAQHPPTALRTAKRFINRNAASALAESIEATALLMASPDQQERSKAFLSGERARTR
jgi:enoyl-CoA hydratase/carnithine racemase